MDLKAECILHYSGCPHYFPCFAGTMIIKAHKEHYLNMGE